VIFELHNGLAVLRGTRRILASVRAADAGPAGHLNLTRHVTGRRIRKTEEFTRSLVFTAYRITSMSDLHDVRAVADGSQGRQRRRAPVPRSPGRSGN
jgi:hypothetical protein